jgi:hypothetical protein
MYSPIIILSTNIIVTNAAGIPNMSLSI